MNPLEIALLELRAPTLEELKEGVRSYQRTITGLEERTTMDTLTGLKNKAFFETYLEQQIKEHMRVHTDHWLKTHYGDKRKYDAVSLGVLFADMNRFKELNDTYGHAAGDEVLKTTGRRLQEILRESDIAARLGGDEFGMILPKLGDYFSLKTMRDRLLERLQQPVLLPDATVYQPQMSLGGVVWTPSAYRIDDKASNQVATDILEWSDKAMYIVKRTTNMDAFLFLMSPGEMIHASYLMKDGSDELPDFPQTALSFIE